MAKRGYLLDLFPLVAQAIDTACQRTEGFASHEKIVEALLAQPEARQRLEDRASRDPKNKPVTWFADNIVAFFSQRYTVGRLGAYEGSFERRKEKSGWAYRRRKNPAR